MAGRLVRKHLTLARQLVEKGILTEVQLQQIFEYQDTHGQDFPTSLRALGFADETRYRQLLTQIYDMPEVKLSSFKIDPKLTKRFPIEMIRKFHFIPMVQMDGSIIIGVSDVMDIVRLDDIRTFTQSEVKCVLVTDKELDEAIAKFYQVFDDITKVAKDVEALTPVEGRDLDVIGDEKEEAIDLEDIKSMAEDVPIVRLVNGIVAQALMRSCSDIHVDPHEEGMRIRYRIDGILEDSYMFDRKVTSATVSRIKIMSGMDIAERRIPQDGRFRVTFRGRVIDFRVATVPTYLGEKVVIRVLDPAKVPLSLEKLGFEEKTLSSFRKCLAKPHGLILVVGPTGSGKTTTLYASLKELNNPDVNILTLENPIEYKLKGINQSQINPKAGLTFEKGLEAFLRQDPDIIFVGEIRNFETAQTAVRASITGHLIFSTLHTNSAIETIYRFIDLGIEPYMIASSLVAVLSQRLVRQVCKKCTVKEVIPEQILIREGLGSYKDMAEYRGVGCVGCNFSGFRGRLGIHELLVMTPEIKEGIIRRLLPSELESIARSQGFRTLREAAIEKVSQGDTTLEEAVAIS